MIFLGSDAAGQQLKDSIAEYLLSRGYKTTDLTPKNIQSVKYPEMAAEISVKVGADVNARGILFSGTGIGMAISANKFPKISAAVVWTEETGEQTRLEDSSNILCLPARFVNPALAQRIVGTWLSTSFSGSEYHADCIKIIRSFEHGKNNV